MCTLWPEDPCVTRQYVHIPGSDDTGPTHHTHTQLGTLAPGNRFEPEHAMIVKDKDDLRVRWDTLWETTVCLACTRSDVVSVLQVPLSLSMIPAPAEFKRAVQSLSPEQIRFAQAYR